MQFYSFDLNDPLIEIAGWKLSFQIITLENIYGLDAASFQVEATGTGWQITCTCLSWAGQQQQADGYFRAEIEREGERGLRVRMQARAPHPIRVVKMLLRDLPLVMPLDTLDQPREVPHNGLLDKYPNQLRLPLLLAELADKTRIGARCQDPHARAKRFATYRERMGKLAGTYTLECIHEEDARWFAEEIEVPLWVLDWDVDAGSFREAQLAFNEQSLGVTPWDIRTDMPAWVRDTSLVLTLHGMHWSGYVFNTYAQMLDIIRFAAERIDGKHILAYLPGWEGRYYWKAGDFSPDERLGGEAGFAALCDGARALGVRVMPMFAATCANAWDDDFQRFGAASYMKTGTRNRFHGNQPDWDLSRTQDTGWQAWLNVGAPAWQDELVRQVRGLIDRFGFDAVFLDCTEVWVNDPDYNLLEGFRQLVARLREGKPDLLITGEDWWDGLLAIFPMFQKASYGRQEPDWLVRYARLFAHIQDPEPGRGSTGVFESGFEQYQPLPESELFIPTIAFVDGTLQTARQQVEAVIEQAKRRHKA